MERLAEIFSFRGRFNRARYIWDLPMHCVMLGVSTWLLLLFGLALPFTLPFLAGWLLGAWTALAAVVKRLHDLGRPGWHALLLLVPVYGLVFFVVTLAARGTEGDNPYGRDPLADPGKLELAP